MILVTGGAYQGKPNYVRSHYNIEENDIFFCQQNIDLDLNKNIIYGFHDYIFGLVKNEVSIDIEEIYDMLKNKIIISNDISQGIVPMDSNIRKWREEHGRIITGLASKNCQVIRVFCGIGMVLKK